MGILHADESLKWESEEIPRDSKLFYRIHENDIESNEPKPIAFKIRGDDDSKSMSTDWEKYSTPKETLARKSDGKKRYIVSLIVSQILEIPKQRVLHSPIHNSITEKDNRAHTDIFWDIDYKKDNALKTQIRAKYLQIYNWEIQPK
jgi:hypothetical protein